MMRRLLYIMLMAMLLPLGSGAKTKRTAAKAKPKTEQTSAKKSTQKSTKKSTKRTSKDAQQQRKQTEQAAAKTAQELKANQAELSRNLRQVTELEQSIESTQAKRKALQSRVDSIAGCIKVVEADIAANEAEVERLRQAYVDAVRSARRNRRELDAVTFILSSDNFSQAEKRTRYLREFSNWRQRKADQIHAICMQLDSQRVELQQLQTQTQALVAEVATQERKLKSDHASLEQAASKLKGKQKQLNAMLSKQQATLTQLDREIDRLIEQELAEERRRQEEERRKREAEAKNNTSGNKTSGGGSAAEYKPVTFANDPQTGEFAKQKGKLPSPLDHTYKVALAFGVQTHRTVKTTQVNNTGIDLETSLGAKAIAVFPGTVSHIYRSKDLHDVVMIRHGSYVTVYANVEATVTKGAKVTTGMVIGTVYPSKYDDKCAELHFEIRKDFEKFNPYPWLKH